MAVVRIQLPVSEACKDHIFERYQDGRISAKGYVAIWNWINKQPMVPDNDWYKRFNEGYLVGKGVSPTSILDKDMQPWGIEVF